VDRINSHGVANLQDPDIKAQMTRKHPARFQPIQGAVKLGSPIDNLKGLREGLLSLKRGGSPGSGGLRVEYLTTLAELLDGDKMLLLESFGLRYLRGELPLWFYRVFLASQSVALFKTKEQVEVRPIGIKHSLVRSFHREVVRQNKGELTNYLEPEQLALSKAGGQKLVFCVRTLLEVNPNFIALKLDIENAQNDISRAKCIEELGDIPELKHLAWHAATTLGPYTALHTGGEIWGEAQEGVTQGDPEATPFYCVTWHKYVREAESTLKAVGGVARFLSDDGYLVGPAKEVFQTFSTFREQLREHCGLNLNLQKCETYIQTGERPEECPPEIPLAGLTKDPGILEPGFICVGIPLEQMSMSGRC